MNSSKPCVPRTQLIKRTRGRAGRGLEAYSDFSFDTDRKLLIEPDLHRRVLLQQLEDEVDWGEEYPPAASTTAASRRHYIPGSRGFITFGC